MKKKIMLNFIFFIFCIFLLFILFYFFSLEKNKINFAEKKVIEQTIEDFWGNIKDTSPENRDIEKVLNLVYFENNDGLINEIRKDYYKTLIVNDFLINDMNKLDDGFYVVDFTINTMIKNIPNIQNVYFYVVYINDNWYIVFGKNNIPERYTLELSKNNIELPSNQIPKDTIPIDNNNIFDVTVN